MCDLTKPSPAKEHFIGLGNGLVPHFPSLVSFTHSSGENLSLEEMEIRFKSKRLSFPLNHKKRSHRLLALVIYNVLVPLFVLSRLIFSRNQHDHIYSRHMPADLINIFIAKLFKVKYIVEINSDIETDRNMSRKNRVITKLLSKFQKFVVNNSTYVVVPTSNLKKNFEIEYKITDNKIIHIENGVSLEKFSQESYATPLKGDKKTIIGFGGTFSVWQGLDLVVDCIKYLDSDFLSKVKFLMVGNGPEYTRIFERVKVEGYLDFFHFTGMVNQNEYISQVKGFDICIAPYIRERNDKWGISPIKIHSYLACKKPIITSDISGAREIITLSNGGYLFEPDNAQSFANAIRHAVENPSEALLKGESGYSYMRDNLTWERLAESLTSQID